jgi:N-methylhydantoinase A
MNEDVGKFTATIGIDVGGTFTDFVAVLPNGNLRFHKEPSTPADPSLAVRSGLDRLVKENSELGGVALRIVHGTTIALNAVLQRKVADIALIVTAGTRDVLEIGRARLPSSFNFHITKETPIVSRDKVLEVGGRMAADGQILERPTDADIERICAELSRLGVGAAAIMLLNSYVDSTLEDELAAAVRKRMPNLLVTCSSQIWPEIREFERAVVACINAQVHPLMESYLGILSERIAESGVEAILQLTSSSGGMLGLITARQRPIETMLSGPASGATAAAKLAQARAIPYALTFDMGGTSADIAVIANGQLEFTTTSHIGDLPLMMPVVGVSSIGAGGGSIISADAQGIIKVGPESAGANPGPVAYGIGGERPTITDCYLVLGIISPDNFLGGRMKLDRTASERALKKIADRLGLSSAEQAAEAAINVATARMTTELFKLLALKGHDPAVQTLLPFGGAGPTHSVLLAHEAGLANVAVPPAAATFCALGAAMADLRRDFVAALGHVRLVETADRLWENWRVLEQQARAWLEEEAIPVLSQEIQYGADMRYAGQSHNLMVSVSAATHDANDMSGVAAAFHTAHEAIYGFRESDQAIEVVTQRLSIIGKVPEVNLPRTAEPDAGSKASQKPTTRKVFQKNEWVTVSVHQRGAMTPGGLVSGPAIVEQSDTTTWIPQGWNVKSDQRGFLLIERS